jgi:hypothetical protein
MGRDNAHDITFYVYIGDMAQIGNNVSLQNGRVTRIPRPGYNGSPQSVHTFLLDTAKGSLLRVQYLYPQSGKLVSDGIGIPPPARFSSGLPPVNQFLDLFFEALFVKIHHPQNFIDAL